MKNNQQMTVRVNGMGSSKAKAFATALMQVQREALKNSSRIILRIEPVDVEVVLAKEAISTERFLFFFFPRKKACYEVTLDIVVDVTFVDISHVGFTSK